MKNSEFSMQSLRDRIALPVMITNGIATAFVMIQNPNSSSYAQRALVIVLNWFEELKRLVPVN